MDYNLNNLVIQPPRETIQLIIYYNTIALGGKVIRDGLARNRLVKELRGEILCFEIKAGGLLDIIPCLVIKGICDYIDSYKTKKWQKYTSVTIAIYIKSLLKAILPV